jgi:hypothetical protein
MTTTTDRRPSELNRILRPLRRGALVLAGLLAAGSFVAGCSSDPTTTAGNAPSTSAAVTTTAAGATATTSSGNTATTAASRAGTKVNANAASSAEIQKALEDAGVPNAARWTKEVLEYRPYPSDDPTLATLKKELQKYNPSADTLAKILGALTV